MLTFPAVMARRSTMVSTNVLLMADSYSGGLELVSSPKWTCGEVKQKYWKKFGACLILNLESTKMD